MPKGSIVKRVTSQEPLALLRRVSPSVRLDIGLVLIFDHKSACPWPVRPRKRGQEKGLCRLDTKI
jgi:hypothetical protein